MNADLSEIAVSRPTLRRLPAYYPFLKQLREQGREVVSCTHIAEHLHLDPTQVRKDLAATGIVGKPRIGYHLDELMTALENFLGWNNSQEGFLVGVGNLGAALLGYDGFAPRGLKIVAAFDNDPGKIGQTVRGHRILDVQKLPSLARRLNILIGILAVPAPAAPAAAELLVDSGIRAIWNLTPAYLTVPPEIIVENVDLSASLAVLSSRLAASMQR